MISNNLYLRRTFSEFAKIDLAHEDRVRTWVTNSLCNPDIAAPQVELEAQTLLQELTSTTTHRRYRPIPANQLSHTEKLLQHVFKTTFQKSVDHLTFVAKATDPEITGYFPDRKKFLHITLPRGTAKLCTGLFPLIIGICAVFAVNASYYKVYAGLKWAISTHLYPRLPHVVTHIALPAIQAADHYVQKHWIKTLLIGALFYPVINRLPRIPYVTACLRVINPWALVFRDSPIDFIWNTQVDTWLAVSSFFQNANYFFSAIANNGAREELKMNGPLAYLVFKKQILLNTPEMHLELLSN